VNHGAANTARPPRADGSALVKDVAEKSANGKTYYVVRFDTELSTGDGQTANQGSTFDAAMAKAARAAKDAGAFVVPTLTRNGRYVNLTGLKDAVGPEGEPEDDGPLSDEQAERIVKTAEGMGWSAADLETLCAKYGAEHPAALPAVKYQEILTALKQGPKALA
jgi:hypothetical protein